MKKVLKTTLLLTLVALLFVATPTTAYAASVNLKVIHASDISTMELYRYAKSQGWTMKWTEKKLSKTKFRTTLNFTNSKYTMSIIQTASLNKNKKAVLKYQQGKVVTSKAGIKRTLKKYKVSTKK
ncbi:hypothetical protein IKF94_02870 [Candidatus Saccharibacteria bacterium]|nr:hypothetical protein [Candidatus Saccharibacteria bacterium]